MNQLTPIQAKATYRALFVTANCLLIGSQVPFVSIAFSNLTYISYTYYVNLKQKTKLNTVFGAVVGALPILVGIFSAIPLEHFNLVHLTLFTYLFLW